MVETYPEVVGVHVDFLRVHHAQLGVGGLDVVHVLHSTVQAPHHCLAMLCYLRVCQNGGGGGQVAKTCEVSLSPGIHNQYPEKKKMFTAE